MNWEQYSNKSDRYSNALKDKNPFLTVTAEELDKNIADATRVIERRKDIIKRKYQERKKR